MDNNKINFNLIYNISWVILISVCLLNILFNLHSIEIVIKIIFTLVWGRIILSSLKLKWEKKNG